MLPAHYVFLIQPTYGSGARKKPWSGRVHGGGRLRPRSANTDLNMTLKQMYANTYA